MLKGRCRYFHSFSSCCLPNLRNPAKFSKNSNLLQLTVIQGHQLYTVISTGANRKRICNFLLVVVTLAVSHTVFEI